ncbi:hypothetical protein PsYK624_141140 [Phanerochaete sordida]|uniref:Uncharacterized protein n=1 Tax=Phanerochaete sordida TaxID=48140 RepID=A0A9P3GM45_9APHY|nr:hypothetical protein PsYK624_141140 [Phanerochaete sordida]
MQAVVVDNTSPQINYVTSWYNHTTTTPDYNSTTAYSAHPDSEFKFIFTGTSVSVFGCILANNTAVSTYTLDADAQSTTFTAQRGTAYLTRQLFFQSPNLEDGAHTLLVTAPASHVGQPWSTFCFDYLTYVPSGAALAPAGNADAEPPSSNLQSSQVSSVFPGEALTAVAAVSLGSSLRSGPSSSAAFSASPAPAHASKSFLISSQSPSLSLTPPAGGISAAPFGGQQASPSVKPSSTSLSSIAASQASPSAAGPHKSNSTLKNLAIILPAVLGLCVFLLAAISMAWWYQRRRSRGLEARIEQSSTPYTQTSLLHRYPSSQTADTSTTTASTDSLHLSLVSPRPTSTYTSNFQMLDRAIAGVALTSSSSVMLLGLHSSFADAGSRVEAFSGTCSGTIAREKGGTESFEEATNLDAPPTYSAE